MIRNEQIEELKQIDEYVDGCPLREAVYAAIATLERLPVTADGVRVNARDNVYWPSVGRVWGGVVVVSTTDPGLPYRVIEVHEGFAAPLVSECYSTRAAALAAIEGRGEVGDE